MLSDLASALVINRQYKEGIEAYRELVSRAESCTSCDNMQESLTAFYYNLGEVSVRGGRRRVQVTGGGGGEGWDDDCL